MMPSAYLDYLQEKIAGKKAEGLYRTLPHYHHLIDFSSNDYLGFARDLSADEWAGGPSGATGSRLISGNSYLAENTEQMIAHFHGEESALIYNCGYMANLGLFSALAQKEELYIYDEYIHASVIDGMRLSMAGKTKFRHNDLADLEEKLKSSSGRRYVAIESIYSMDGDLAPLREISTLCNRYGAALIVDEAHSTGICGDGGKGLVNELGLEGQMLARIHTYGKALGLHGAAILGPEILRSYLINHSRALIFTTALPPHNYLMLQKAYKALPAAPREKLMQLIAYFGQKAAHTAYSWKLNPSPIQALICPGNENAKALATALQYAGLAIKAILHPSVERGKERLRICLHSFNTEAEIDYLFETLKKYHP